MSLRPSGCGGRSDAVPPHVENRRRFSRPSSFIMGPARSSLTGGEEDSRGSEGRKEGEGTLWGGRLEGDRESNSL